MGYNPTVECEGLRHPPVVKTAFSYAQYAVNAYYDSHCFLTSAMPQMGQLPGLFRTTSGCIGQVY